MSDDIDKKKGSVKLAATMVRCVFGYIILTTGDPDLIDGLYNLLSSFK
ncbi:hypothetical protein KAR91_48055 [Candidatus Pacearchaeota archaeon]|nr:hypothetical protein [Candidatus Pacearchaeota archaeon]